MRLSSKITYCCKNKTQWSSSFGTIGALGFMLLLGQNHPWTPQARVAGLMANPEKLTLEDESVVFIGDSITEGWQWDTKSRNIWAKHYTPRHAYNCGFAGDKTEQVLYRIANNYFDGMNPKVAVLMIGTNNLLCNTVEEIAQGIQEILKQLAVKQPETKVILVSILPRAMPLKPKAKQLNALIKKLADDKTVHWLELTPEFETPEGHQKIELFLNDKIHLNAAGYHVWQKTMEPLLDKLYQAK